MTIVVISRIRVITSLENSEPSKFDIKVTKSGGSGGGGRNIHIAKPFPAKGGLNPQNTEIFNLNFQSIEVVSRYTDTQLQVTENLCDL